MRAQAEIWRSRRAATGGVEAPGTCDDPPLAGGSSDHGISAQSRRVAEAIERTRAGAYGNRSVTSPVGVSRRRSAEVRRLVCVGAGTTDRSRRAYG